MTDKVEDNYIATYHEYLERITSEAKELGYTLNQVLMFTNDIYESWLNGESVTKVVDEIFG